MLATLLLSTALTVAAQRPPTPDELIGERIRRRLEAAGAEAHLSAAGEPIQERAVLAAFYLRHRYQPAWSDEHGPHRLADDLVETLRRADLDGFRPEEYHLGNIQLLLDAVRADASGGHLTNPERAAELDLLLTDAFLVLGSHLLAGRVDPETLHPRWVANPRGADLMLVLQDALEDRKIARALQRLAPAHAGYRRLRDALARERARAVRGGWPALPAGGVLARGDTGAQVTALRERLRLGGDLEQSGGGGDAGFDESLRRALLRFQRRHGLDESGKLDAATRAELDVPAQQRVHQLELNLERWRWLPQDLGRRRIVVNIAAYELDVVEDEEIVMTMRVVVGRRYRRTPVFSDSVRYIVLNPYWHVPRNIAVSDLLPKIQNDPSYLERHGMRVFEGSSPNGQELDAASVDWSAVTAENFKFRLNQEPGRLNALGRVKFMFPNRYDVYLHDTPSRDLFDESQRDFSSGCIRLEKPLELAAHLTKKDGRWNREALEVALDAGTERTIYLPRPTAIHLLYWTAWADDDGTIQFRPDIHRLDQPLADALQTHWPREIRPSEGLTPLGR